MYSQYRNILTVCLCFLWLPVSLSCNMESMMVCHYQDEINHRSYTMLFTQSLTDFVQTCQKQKHFLGCAYWSEHTVGCSCRDLVTLHSLNSTHHAVCGNNLAAYNRSRPCILQTKESIHECLRPFWKARERDERCQELTEARECIQNSVIEKKECSREDMRFLGKVIDSGLIPYAHPEVHNCELTMSAATTPATTTEASTTAQTSTTTSTGAAQTVRQDFECHRNYMFVFIPVDLVPNSQLTLRDPNCRLVNNGTHHKISLDYDECGTSQSFYTDHISVENDVNVHSIFNDTEEITFVEDYKIPLRCSVDRSKLVNGVIQVMPRESVQESVVQSSEFNMKEFTTKDYNQEITEYPVKLPINREIFFEIALTNRSSDSAGIFVEKCQATPSTNPNDTVHVSLINFGCSVIPAVKVLPAPGIDRFRFSFQAFHFSAPSNDNNLVYVHCSASTCGGILCDNACPQSSRRRKRSARGRASATLTSGSHVVS